MRRIKPGDVFAFKTERGYRIIQWAYSIERRGNFVRVFPGFYKEIPDAVDDLISSDCSYIIGFALPKLYRKGMLDFVCSMPLESIPPFPKYDINYRLHTGEFEICESDCHQNFEVFKGRPDGRGIPKKYGDVKLINGCVDPVWFIYLLTSDFDLKHWDLFYPGKAKHEEFMKKYESFLFN